MTTFPLCTRAGLTRVYFSVPVPDFYIRASEVESLFERAPVVYGAKETGFAEKLISNHPEYEDDTHKARLIMIEPLKVESEEIKLLREYLSKDLMLTPVNDWLELKARAKAFLGKLDKGEK